MNFKITLPLLLILSFGCGLKTKPKAPEGSELPSITKKYQYKFDKKKSKNSDEIDGEDEDKKNQ